MHCSWTFSTCVPVSRGPKSRPPPSPSTPPPAPSQALAARVMVLYAFLLDCSAYGSYAATGGNLLASIAAGTVVCLGVGAVETVAEGAMQLRLRLAGRMRAN